MSPGMKQGTYCCGQRKSMRRDINSYFVAHLLSRWIQGARRVTAYIPSFCLKLHRKPTGNGIGGDGRILRCGSLREKHTVLCVISRLFDHVIDSRCVIMRADLHTIKLRTHDVAGNQGAPANPPGGAKCKSGFRFTDRDVIQRVDGYWILGTT